LGFGWLPAGTPRGDAGAGRFFCRVQFRAVDSGKSIRRNRSGTARPAWPAKGRGKERARRNPGRRRPIVPLKPGTGAPVC